MNRKEITEWLRKLLIENKLQGFGKHYSSEVTFDYGTKKVRRIDFLLFEPLNQMCIDSIEKGTFTVFEIKSCKADFKSGYGRNFIAEKNYYVMTMETYKSLLYKEIAELPPEVGVYVAIPTSKDVYDEFVSPTDIESDCKWKLHCIKKSIGGNRYRSMIELLFCMLRSGK